MKSTIVLTDHASHWVNYHPLATQRLQQTIRNTEYELDGLILELIHALNAWNDSYSLTGLQSILCDISYAYSMGIVLPDCYNLINAEGFLTYIASKDATFAWTVGDDIGEGDNPASHTTNVELKNWVATIKKLDKEPRDLESLFSRMRISMGNMRFDYTFRPNQRYIQPPTLSTEDLLEVLGYQSLWELQPNLAKPDYKNPVIAD